MDKPEDRHYTTIFRAALDAGLKLYITEGVIEELDGHLNLCLASQGLRREHGGREFHFFTLRMLCLAGREESSLGGWKTFMGVIIRWMTFVSTWRRFTQLIIAT